MGLKAISSDITGGSPGTFSSLTVTDLTATRIPFISTGGLFVDSSTLTYSATNGLTTTLPARSPNFAASQTNTVGSVSDVTLTRNSTYFQTTTGSTAQNYILPDATTLAVGWAFDFNNNMTGDAAVTVKANGGSTIATVPAGGRAVVFAIAVSTAAGSWDFHYLVPSNASWGTAGLSVTGTLTVSALTSGRVPYASTSGLFIDSANLRFDGTSLTLGSGSAILGGSVYRAGTTGQVSTNTDSIRAGSGNVIGFSSSADVGSAASDTGFSRISAGVVGVGTGAQGSVAGTVQATLFDTRTGGSTTISTGVGSVKMSTANAATNTAWIPLAYAGTTYYVPAWTTNAP